MVDTKIPLARFGAIEIKDQQTALEHCRRTFPEVDGFVFQRNKTPHLQSAGVNLGDIRISTAGSTGHRISLADDRHVTVLIPFRRKISVSSVRRSVQAVRGGIIVTDTGSRTTEVAENYVGGVIKIPKTGLVGRLGGMSSYSRRPALPDLSGETHKNAELAALRRYSLYLFGELERSDVLLDNERARANSAALLVELTFIAFLRLGDQSGESARYPMASLRQVQQAEQLMRARLNEAISVADIADGLDISTRALQLAFQRHRQVTPWQFLDTLRLEEIRRRLTTATASESVTKIAFECGVGHLSRFANRYRQRFAETPSATLRAALRKI
jgi:AraC-like DNA-binding protein